MRKTGRVLLVLILTAVIMPCYAANAWTTYDSFNTTKYIDPANWVGQENEANTGYRVIRENLRQIEGGRARLQLRAWGANTGSDSGYQYGQNRMRAPNLKNMTGMQTSVQLKAMSLVGSSANPYPSTARARLV